MEILIVDGMSDDGTRQILSTFVEDRPLVNIFDNINNIVACGLNLLTLHARGEILIRVDVYCVIAPDYISKCVRYLQTKNVDGVGGSMQSVGENYVSQVIALAMSSKFVDGGPSFHTDVD